ncbi:GntR family transcriptional regulator [Pseudonocardia sichuanensis]|uniref:DNA-binding GntR family transcriptional regulator n=1 Tax=Pseudonocardia kunmingensis TaxID=630975 RepID=A0A543D0W9_9PSEU|nr:GntR family transcriptional regulator [Pseudonocardia kunmingensis]TQM02985.1 DNA-binding GntR family transcriptional regulator [Pseudonocardia kunmingensis]
MPRKPARTTTKAEEAFSVVRRKIERGELPGGAKLTLQSLSDEMQMSLTPIREALRMLQAHGLVEYRPHHGHVVTRYSIPRAEEIYLLRVTLEPLATRLAAENATDEELAEIRGLHEEFRAAAEKEDGAQGVIVDLNALWHRAVYEAAHSSFLDDFIDRLWTGVPYQAIWFIHRRHRSVQDHAAVTDALLARHADAAASGMHDHILRGKQATIDHLRAIGAPDS